MKLTEKSVIELLADLQSSAPTPGGGSASALTGAVGASLLTMVAGLAKPIATTPEDLGRLAAAGARCHVLADRLAALVNEDAEAYERVMTAYRLPKASQADQDTRSAAIQEALRGATATPLEVMRHCGAAIEQGAVVAALGNRNARSDVMVGLELLAAGLRGARLNVDINLPSLKDSEYAAGAAEEAARLAAECGASVAAARAQLTS